jgi:hypothetical protein
MRRKKRDEAVLNRAKEMHDECMKDPEYAAKWNALTSALFGILADLPEDAVSAERE